MLIRDGRVRRAYLGIGGAATPIGRQLAAELRIPNASGIRVLEVTAGRPAQRAGIRAGDLIVTLDDVPLATLSDLQRVLAADWIGPAAGLAFVRFREAQRAAAALAGARSPDLGE